MGTRSLEDAIEASHNALAAIINGDPSGYRALYAEDEVPTLGNPFGPFAHGRQGVFERLSGAAANYEDGEVTGVEPIAKYVSDDLACVVEVESYRAKIGGSEDIASASLRVTSVFRLECGNWKLVHRHADPITTPRSAASIIGG